MSSMQHVARCVEMQRVRYSVTLFSGLQRVASMTGSNINFVLGNAWTYD